MSDTSVDWTNWIITTVMAALGTMVGTVVFLAKLIESKYTQEVKRANEEITSVSAKLDAQTKKHEDCMDLHHKAELRLARLEEQIKTKVETEHN